MTSWYDFKLCPRHTGKTEPERSMEWLAKCYRFHEKLFLVTALCWPLGLREDVTWIWSLLPINFHLSFNFICKVLLQVPGEHSISFVQASHAVAVFTRGQPTEKCWFLQPSAAPECSSLGSGSRRSIWGTGSELRSVLPVGSAGSWDVLVCVSEELLLLFYRVVHRGVYQGKWTFKIYFNCTLSSLPIIKFEEKKKNPTHFKNVIQLPSYLKRKCNLVQCAFTFPLCSSPFLLISCASVCVQVLLVSALSVKMKYQEELHLVQLVHV